MLQDLTLCLSHESIINNNNNISVKVIKDIDNSEISEKNESKNKQTNNSTKSNLNLDEKPKVVTKKNQLKSFSLANQERNIPPDSMKVLYKIEKLTTNNDEKFNEINSTITKFSEKFKELDKSLLNFDKTVH
jgi:hypothetical protein